MEPGQVSTVSGVVTDDAGRPLADAAVAFTRAPVPVPDIAVLTGADGRFVLAAPAPGAYTVAVNAPGHDGRTADLRVDPGGAQEVHVEITVPGGPGGSADPAGPADPRGPSGPGGPADPAGPAGHAGPGDPGGHGAAAAGTEQR